MATLVKEGGSNDGLKVEHSTETPKLQQENNIQIVTTADSYR